jgi:hypothetical protein
MGGMERRDLNGRGGGEDRKWKLLLDKMKFCVAHSANHGIVWGGLGAVINMDKPTTQLASQNFPAEV